MTPEKLVEQAEGVVMAYKSGDRIDYVMIDAGAALVPQLAAALKRACDLLETYAVCDGNLRPYLTRNTMSFPAGDVVVQHE